MSNVRRQSDEKSRYFGGMVKLPFGDSGVCSCRSIDRDYDPGNFQIGAPIVYINGEFDPATPLDGAKSHFASQTKTPKKVFITVKDGGHFGTWNELESCTDLLFQSGISGDLSDLSGPRDFSHGCPNGTRFPDTNSAVR